MRTQWPGCRAGAILLGKTNVPIFTADFQTYDSIYGTTNNPWNQDLPPWVLGRSRGGHRHRDVRPRTRLGSRRLDPLAGALLRYFRPENDVEPCLDVWPYPVNARVAPRTQSRAPCRGPARPLTLLSPSTSWPGPRDPLMEALASPRNTTPRGLRVALWLDEPFAPVDATVATAVRKAALMLAEAGAIVDESARPALSIEEAWEIFAVLTHALIGAGLPDKARDKLAAREHDFLTGDLFPPRSASARDAPKHTGFHRHSDAAGAASPGVDTVSYTHLTLPTILRV